MREKKRKRKREPEKDRERESFILRHWLPGMWELANP